MSETKKKVRRKPVPGTSECRQYFYDQFQKTQGRPYNPTFTKDAQIFRMLISRYPIDWVKGMIDFYLQWDDKFVKDCGYTTGVLYCKVNEMLGERVNIHKSQWVKKHEVRAGLKPAKEILANIMGGKFK